MTAAPQSVQPVTASERDQIVARLAELQVKQEAATEWGAAVGAREEEIRSLESRLLRIDSMTAGNQPSSGASDGLWLIVKRGLYFRPDCKGYTGIKDEAGRYKFDFAKDYDRGECKIVREEDGLEFMPVAYNDLVIKHLTVQRDEARAEVARLSGVAQGAVSCGAGLLETNPALFDILNSALGTMHYHRLMSALNWNGYQIVRPDTLSAVTPSPGPGEDWSERLAERVMQLQAAGAETLTCAQVLGLIAFVRDGEGSAVTSTTRDTAAEEMANRWPLGCHSPNSCHSNKRCMYVGCRHDGTDAMTSTQSGGEA